MNKLICICIFSVFVFLISCSHEIPWNSYSLQASDDFLNFEIDEDTRLPKFNLWSFEEEGKDYLAFSNMGREILFYDIGSQKLIKKIKYEREGVNGIENVISFFVTDFSHISVSSSYSLVTYVTDSTGQIRSKIEYEKTKDGIPLTIASVSTMTRNPLSFIGDSMYVAQDPNRMIGDGDYVSKSPIGFMIDKHTNQITVNPLKHHLYFDNVKKVPASTGGNRISHCFDGTDLIISREVSDSIYKLSPNFKRVSGFLAKSRYINHPKAESIADNDLQRIVKRACELPVYGSIIYDKYREVYYRFAFPEVEMEKERDYLSIYHSGRKQFSIIILDKDMKVVGETLFPEYTYNPYLLFIRKDGLYMSTSHFKRSDFDENVLRFQKIELVNEQHAECDFKKNTYIYRM